MPRRYATAEEAIEARRQSQREATKRYLASDRGRAKRAEIQARYINSDRGRATRQQCRDRERERRQGNLTPPNDVRLLDAQADPIDA